MYNNRYYSSYFRKRKCLSLNILEGRTVMCFKRLLCMLLATAMIVGFVPKIDAQATTILPLEEFEEEIVEESFEEAEQNDFSETVVEEDEPDMVLESAEIQATTPSSVTEEQVIERMKTVKAMEGKYFTVDGASCGNDQVTDVVIALQLT